jgi:hypothetical protein
MLLRSKKKNQVILQAMHEFCKQRNKLLYNNQKKRLAQQDKNNTFKKHITKANEIDSMLVSPHKNKETQK